MSRPLLRSIDTPDCARSSAVHDEYMAEFHSHLYSSRSSCLNFVSVRIVTSTVFRMLLNTACLFCLFDDIPPTFLHLTLRLAGLTSLTPVAYWRFYPMFGWRRTFFWARLYLTCRRTSWI